MTGSPSVTPAPGKPFLLLGAFGIRDVGYVAEEFFVSGTASSYAAGGPLNPDGQWDVSPSETADYTTRLVALTPADPARFNGTVLVEWLNVSGGIDAPAVWMMAHREVIRSGYAYVAVSAQRVGVEGGASMLGADMSLKSQDPARYAPLHHPGDGFSYDIFSQVGGLIGNAGGAGVLRGLRARHVAALGESQSAMFLTTYVNAVDPLARAFDAFFVHSRFASAAPLDGTSIFDENAAPEAVAFRRDLRVPLLAVITETDLFGAVREGYYFARQPDNERLRVWEIPGTAHADNYTIQVAPIDSGSAPLADIVAAYTPTKALMGRQLSHYINFAPQHHYVVQAAVDALNSWVDTGEPAPTAPPIEVRNADRPQPLLDANGLARGGVRTPWVDVPIARTSGFGGEDSLMSAIFGSGEPFDAGTLTRLYPNGADEYLERFTAALDGAIHSGFILAADRAEILQLAAATFPSA
jgi:Alpha/beta hydrolase domain